MRTIIWNIGLLATPRGVAARKGADQGRIDLIPETYLVLRDGLIEEVGPAHSSRTWPRSGGETLIDAGRALVTPGLVDAHTHLIFSGWRQRELALKLQGVPYLEILKQGGGILHTVKNTRQASRDELIQAGQKSLAVMLAHGTTTCEIKSGYGLTLEDELKALAVVRELQNSQPLDLVPTFMGAHAVPPEYKNAKGDYIKLLCDTMIPAVAQQGLAEFCDVFCEQGVFSLAETETILACGQKHGLTAKIHADEITPLGGAGLAAGLGAISAEHLIHATDDGLAKMAAAGTIAVLLPGTSFYLNEDFARAKTMIDLDIAVAIATDFNPGSCPTESLQMPMTLACLKYRLTPAQVLTAVTLNAAAALGRAETIGSVEPGKQADLVIWAAPDLDFIFYHWGTNLVRQVVKNGETIFRRDLNTP